MRIGIDATPLPPQPVGAGNYILHLVRSLAALDCGFEFVVFAQPRGYDLIHVPSKTGFEFKVVSEKSPPLRLLWEQSYLPALARRAGVDLLHSLHYTRPSRLGCASVVTFHDMTFFLFPELHTLPKRIFFPRAIRFSARRSDALIADSESTRKDSIRILNIPPGKIFTVPLGVTRDFHPVSDEALLVDARHRYRLPEKFILSVGLVEPRKNLPLLLRSFKKAADRGCQMPLVIVGRFGWGYQEVLSQIEHLELTDRVILAGYVPSQDLPLIYNLAQVFIYPSLYEGFGLPPLEAMACGTPVITSAVSSMPEHVGEAGMLVPPGDEEALVDAILEIMGLPELRRHLAEAGPRQAALFTWERTARETLQVYRHVLGLL